MRQSKAGLITVILYIGFVIAASIWIQQRTDSEDKLAGTIMLGLPWDLLFIKSHIRYRPFLPALVLAMNVATVYLIVAWLPVLMRWIKTGRMN